MNFEYLVGDVLNSNEPVVAHGCNTKGVMGSGIAKQVKAEHPEVYNQYRQACAYGDFIVGTAQSVYSSPAGHPSGWIYNLGTQRNPGRDATTWAIFLSFANLAESLYDRELDRVAIPRIGCGIGGLTWYPVSSAITAAVEASSHPDLTIAVYDLP